MNDDTLVIVGADLAQGEKLRAAFDRAWSKYASAPSSDIRALLDAEKVFTDAAKALAYWINEVMRPPVVAAAPSSTVKVAA